MDNQLRVSFEYLSGDEPGTKGMNEGWVPLWGRWPQWSELYVYTVAFTGEQRIAEITDLERLAFGWSVKPTDKLTFAADYHLLFAPDERQGRHAGVQQQRPLPRPVADAPGDVRVHQTPEGAHPDRVLLPRQLLHQPQG